VNGGWFFYTEPVYPYPHHVSETVYDEPAQDYGDYWYYCRDPEGYYPYVRQCNGAWEPVAPQPSYANGGGPSADEMGSGDYGPPDEGGSDDYGPSDEGGGYDDYGPDDQGPPDEGPPTR
jgi:hypothetical protein